MLTHGTVAWKTAVSARAPLRMVAAFSACGADDEAGLVDEVHRRQVEGVAEVDEAGHLLAAVGGQPAAVVVGVVGEHADGVAVEAGEPVTTRVPAAAADLEQ